MSIAQDELVAAGDQPEGLLDREGATPNDMPESSGVVQVTQSEYIDSELEQPRPCPVVVLVGPPGAGKSTIGRRLARALNLGLTDSDVLIEEAEGKTCGEVFTELGEPAFRELESAHVAEALRTTGVVSLGGGAVLTPSTRELLKRHNVVWIDVSPEEGARRTASENTRPVLAASDPAEHYRMLVEERRPLYREVSRFRARTDRRSPQKVVADILGFLESAN